MTRRAAIGTTAALVAAVVLIVSGLAEDVALATLWWLARHSS